MSIREQIGKILVALVLFTALMIPSATQFVHLFEEHHDHHFVTCEDHSESHIHEYEAKCDICCSFSDHWKHLESGGDPLNVQKRIGPQNVPEEAQSRIQTHFLGPTWVSCFESALFCGGMFSSIVFC